MLIYIVVIILSNIESFDLFRNHNTTLVIKKVNNFNYTIKTNEKLNKN